MNNEQIYNKAKEAHRKAYENIENSLEELLYGKYEPQFENIIEVLFKGRGNTCKSGLICWNTLRQIETEYITAAYNFIVAGRNI